jgi:hypothetical protein
MFIGKIRIRGNKSWQGSSALLASLPESTQALLLVSHHVWCLWLPHAHKMVDALSQFFKR